MNPLLVNIFVSLKIDIDYCTFSVSIIFVAAYFLPALYLAEVFTGFSSLSVTDRPYLSIDLTQQTYQFCRLCNCIV
jgi:hypothetical protein